MRMPLRFWSEIVERGPEITSYCLLNSVQSQPTALRCFLQVNLSLPCQGILPCFSIHSHTSAKLDCLVPERAPKHFHPCVFAVYFYV